MADKVPSDFLKNLENDPKAVKLQLGTKGVDFSSIGAGPIRWFEIAVLGNGKSVLKSMDLNRPDTTLEWTTSWFDQKFPAMTWPDIKIEEVPGQPRLTIFSNTPEMYALCTFEGAMNIDMEFCDANMKFIRLGRISDFSPKCNYGAAGFFKPETDPMPALLTPDLRTVKVSAGGGYWKSC